MSLAKGSFALSVIDSAYNRQSWHGTNLRGSVRGLSMNHVVRRPKPGAHNIWELVVHCAYWKYVVRRRLTGGKRGSFPLAGSNFFERPVCGASRRLKFHPESVASEQGKALLSAFLDICHAP